MSEKNETLVNAMKRRESDYVNALAVARSGHDMDDETVSALREAIELTRCLRRLVPGMDVVAIHRAFGAPGDFGYDTPIGDALARTYRSDASS